MFKIQSTHGVEKFYKMFYNRNIIIKNRKEIKNEKDYFGALLLISLLSIANTCRADLIIVNTPSGTSICTPIGNGSSVICN